MTPNQIKWAASHDWFIAALPSGDGILVRDEWINMNEAPDEITGQRPLHIGYKVFSDFKSLRNWAGY